MQARKQKRDEGRQEEIRQGKEKRKGMQRRRGIIYIDPTVRHLFFLLNI